MKRILAIVLFAVFLTVVVGFVLFQILGTSSQDSPYELARLPDSPLFASYTIEESEVVLTDGIAEGVPAGLKEGERIEVLGEPVFGDVSGDEREDALLVLASTKNSDEMHYYIALALKDTDGFLGVNAVPLSRGGNPERVSVRDELVEVEYTETVTNENGEEQEVASVEYFRLLGISLHAEERTEEERIERGMYAYGHESRVFTPCNSDTTYWLSPDSNSLAALQAIYTERTKGREPYSTIYIVLKGKETESPIDGFGADFAQAFNVTGILSVPKNGSCEGTL